MTIAVGAKWKLGFATGKVTKLDEDDDSYDKWL